MQARVEPPLLRRSCLPVGKWGAVLNALDSMITRTAALEPLMSGTLISLLWLFVMTAFLDCSVMELEIFKRSSVSQISKTNGCTETLGLRRMSLLVAGL